MESEINRKLHLLMSRGALINGQPTSETFVNTTDSLEALADALGIRAAGGGQFEADGVPDFWDALVTDSSTQADIVTLTGNRDAAVIQRLAAIINALNITDTGAGTGLTESGTRNISTALGTDGGTITDSATSVLGAIGANNANNAFVSTSVVANGDGSVLERLEDIKMIGHDGEVLEVTADFSSATWNTVATHEVFTVTGAVKIRIIPEITLSLAGASAAIQLGNESVTTAYIGSTGVLEMTTNRLWLTTTPSQDHDYSGDSASVIERVINEWDIGYQVTTAAFTGGTIIFRAYWMPLEVGSLVAAGNGSTL